MDLEGAQAIQTEELIVEEDVDYVLSVGEERIALQPKTLQDKPVKELISVRKLLLILFALFPITCNAYCSIYNEICIGVYMYVTVCICMLQYVVMYMYDLSTYGSMSKGIIGMD